MKLSARLDFSYPLCWCHWSWSVHSNPLWQDCKHNVAKVAMSTSLLTILLGTSEPVSQCEDAVASFPLHSISRLPETDCMTIRRPTRLPLETWLMRRDQESIVTDGALKDRKLYLLSITVCHYACHITSRNLAKVFAGQGNTFSKRFCLLESNSRAMNRIQGNFSSEETRGFELPLVTWFRIGNLFSSYYQLGWRM